ncbi:MAG: outer membrane beta-barrel protein [bacterium]|nr:outer membrane beta-barrel protein [bacterium]
MKGKMMGGGIFLVGLAMVFLVPLSKPAWGEEAGYTDDAFASGTFHLSAPDISFSFQSSEESSSTTFAMHPTLGYFVIKYISIGARASITYTDYVAETITSYGFGGALQGFVPIGPRVYARLGIGGGYNLISGRADDYFGPDLTVDAGAGYFLNRYLSVGPSFTFDRIFGDPAESIFSVGLDFHIFFPGGE